VASENYFCFMSWGIHGEEGEDGQTTKRNSVFVRRALNCSRGDLESIISFLFGSAGPAGKEERNKIRDRKL
jgi:hypothetical protein